ncbi:MAG: hypothetical protein HYR96_12605 [Deltaproteobacteria bacterium]|nr:hypothetical protein [Deltaproteobacteria bacterium]
MSQKLLVTLAVACLACPLLAYWPCGYLLEVRGSGSQIQAPFTRLDPGAGGIMNPTPLSQIPLGAQPDTSKTVVVTTRGNSNTPIYLSLTGQLYQGSTPQPHTPATYYVIGPSNDPDSILFLDHNWMIGKWAGYGLTNNIPIPITPLFPITPPASSAPRAIGQLSSGVVAVLWDKGLSAYSLSQSVPIFTIDITTPVPSSVNNGTPIAVKEFHSFICRDDFCWILAETQNGGWAYLVFNNGPRAIEKAYDLPPVSHNGAQGQAPYVPLYFDTSGPSRLWTLYFRNGADVWLLEMGNIAPSLFQRGLFSQLSAYTQGFLHVQQSGGSSITLPLTSFISGPIGLPNNGQAQFPQNPINPIYNAAVMPPLKITLNPGGVYPTPNLDPATALESLWPTSADAKTGYGIERLLIDHPRRKEFVVRFPSSTLRTWGFSLTAAQLRGPNFSDSVNVTIRDLESTLSPALRARFQSEMLALYNETRVKKEKALPDPMGSFLLIQLLEKSNAQDFYFAFAQLPQSTLETWGLRATAPDLVNDQGLSNNSPVMRANFLSLMREALKADPTLQKFLEN